MKTTIYLPDDLKAAVERAAAAEGCSEAELIRSAVQEKMSGSHHRCHACRCGPRASVTRRSRNVSTSCSKGSAARERSRGAVILLDTSGLLAALVPDQRDHEAAARVLTGADVPLGLSPFVLAELDYLIGRLLGTEATVTLLDEVARGAYRLAAFGADDIARARDIIGRYADLGIGLADASIVVLADALGTRDVLTLDERKWIPPISGLEIIDHEKP